MSRAAKRRFEGNASEPHKALLSLFKQFGHRYSVHEVFADFVEIAALSISNTVDRHHAEAREKRYEEIIKRYERVDRERFPQMFGALVQTVEDLVQGWVPNGDGLADVLGQTYMMLELGNDKAGQFFTPYSVSRLMARMNIGDGAPFVQRDGFVTLSEPASGAGGMAIACADALHDAGHNYQQTMHATCIDIDPRAHDVCPVGAVAHPRHRHSRQRAVGGDLVYLVHAGTCRRRLGREAQISPPGRGHAGASPEPEARRRGGGR